MDDWRKDARHELSLIHISDAKRVSPVRRQKVA